MIDKTSSFKQTPTKLALLLASFCFFTAHFAMASNETMADVEIYNCEKDFCVKLVAPQLYKSSMGHQYAFGPSQLSVITKHKLVKSEFQDFEGSFDPRDGRFYLSKKASPIGYVIDTKVQQIYRFPPL